MILPWLIAIPGIAGVLGWALARRNHLWARRLAMAGMAIDLGLALTLWRHGAVPPAAAGGGWLAEFQRPWIPQLGVTFHLAADGLSLLLVLLTALLGLLSVGASWNSIRQRVGLFHLNLMLVLAGIMGVFLAVDLFAFYFFWELMLVPMYFLIALWGHENRHYAAVKFFLFTQLSGLLMLLAILGVYFLHGHDTGEYTFDYARLLGWSPGPGTGAWLMLGFLAAFLVKLPAVPLHTWLPDAHTEAPTAGSVVLAGLLLKTGAYGLLRFVWPLFPEAARTFAPAGMVLGTVGILYGAVLAFAQTDLKRLIAYTSISHLGFVLLGAFAANRLALQGAVMQMVCHGLSTGALFILAGALQDRIGTREIARMGGLWSSCPRLGASAMFFALAALGLPGLGNFVGEFLVLLGAWRVNVAVASAATGGLVLATVYALWMIQQVFHGPSRQEWKIADLRPGELAIVLVLVAGLVWLGLYPQPVLDMTAGTTAGLEQAAGGLRSAARERAPCDLPIQPERAPVQLTDPGDAP